MSAKTLGIIGIGKIGSIVAKQAKCLNMQIICHSRSFSQSKAQGIGIRAGNLDEVPSQSNYVSIHLPKTEQTTTLISAEQFKRMKEGSYLVCTARGGIVNEDALYHALHSGKLAGATLDVFEKEPPGASRLMDLPNFICTPHIGAFTYEAQSKVAQAAGEHMRDFLIEGIIHN